jgi:IS1 family transposase
MRLLVKTGDKCQKIMDKYLRGFHCKKIQVDEIWTFVRKKEKRLKGKEVFDLSLDDQYVFVAIDANTKLIPCFTIGKRTAETTLKFIWELKEKLEDNGRIQLTSDGFNAYITAIEEAFGADIDFAQLIKIFASDFTEPGRYSPPRVTEVLSKIINGMPDPKHICTSFVERQNLTMRMQMRRFTRLTNAFSKKLENLKAAVSLHFAWYNFGRIHQTLRVTLAMEAGITNHIWDWKELVFIE